ncbi:MAG TPA: hypothetical protein VJ877_03620, partial [Bacteroidales bacterium]|nr:hypothetical protein [Bacteroidales bacterium]
SLGRYLAEDIESDIDMPPFNKTAVDGYACRKADLDRELLINEVIPAGVPASRTVEEGQCAKIMTGRPCHRVPTGYLWLKMPWKRMAG